MNDVFAFKISTLCVCTGASWHFTILLHVCSRLSVDLWSTLCWNRSCHAWTMEKILVSRISDSIWCFFCDICLDYLNCEHFTDYTSKFFILAYLSVYNNLFDALSVFRIRGLWFVIFIWWITCGINPFFPAPIVFIFFTLFFVISWTPLLIH